MHDVWPPAAVGVGQPLHRGVVEVGVEQQLDRAPASAPSVPYYHAVPRDLLGHGLEFAVRQDQMEYVDTNENSRNTYLICG